MSLYDIGKSAVDLAVRSIAEEASTLDDFAAAIEASGHFASVRREPFRLVVVGLTEWAGHNEDVLRELLGPGAEITYDDDLTSGCDCCDGTEFGPCGFEAEIAVRVRA